MSHAANPDLLNCLKRAQGHLAKIVELVAEGRDGLLIAPQIRPSLLRSERPGRCW